MGKGKELNLKSRYNVPKIMAQSVEQAAYAFALRECYIYMEDGIEECVEVLGEIAGITDLPWIKVLNYPVYVCFFCDTADSIINAIKNVFIVGIIDLRVLGYEHKNGKDYDRYLEDFKNSDLYELIEDEDGE